MPWIAATLALLLTGAGLLAIWRGAGGPLEATPSTSGSARGTGSGADRQALLLEIARLDEAFAAKSAPTRAERRAYERRRSELLTGLRAEG